ncbi:hypothetical protein EIP91_006485 [Steccherinum ochraceum]|uniref:Cyclin-like domain-containing protein n=1 Tax=Steccherinum ochraceum TaxID=92696 RepID=A0A4R0RZ51_9APHY|nr:hypothetical protein EIP91_006485 [Steccherinum ochraceum]
MGSPPGERAITGTQWLFPISALAKTPSRQTSNIPLEKELYDRARGVEFLFRIAVSLVLPSSAMLTAATWFHRFYMRYSLEDYHRQASDGAACIFLATKTEECGRKLRDVAKIYFSKINRIDPKELSDDSKEIEDAQIVILATEEVLLEALCFDFVVESPHKDLVELFDARDESFDLQECAWSIANDSYRTPLCILFRPAIIAAACYILAQYMTEGPQSTSLSERIASPAPSASLPTPPTQHPMSSQSARFAIEFFKFNEMDLSSLGEAITIILEFYGAQDIQDSAAYLAGVASVTPPSAHPNREHMYLPLAHVIPQISHIPSGSNNEQQTTSESTPGSQEWKPATEDRHTKPKISDRLDLS